jgi:hypothetical protein
MSPKDAVARYYDAWISQHGDMSDVPLAAGFTFRGPVADFDDAESYRAMAAFATPVPNAPEVEVADLQPFPHTYRGSAYGIMVLTVDGGHIIEITGFADPALLADFGLPARLEG